MERPLRKYQTTPKEGRVEEKEISHSTTGSRVKNSEKKKKQSIDVS